MFETCTTPLEDENSKAVGRVGVSTVQVRQESLQVDACKLHELCPWYTTTIDFTTTQHGLHYLKAHTMGWDLYKKVLFKISDFYWAQGSQQASPPISFFSQRPCTHFQCRLPSELCPFS